MPFNAPPVVSFPPTTDRYTAHPSLQIPFPTEIKPAAALPLYSSKEHEAALGFYTTDNVPPGRCAIFTTGRSFTALWTPNEEGRRIQRIQGAQHVVGKTAFGARERDLRSNHSPQRVVVLRSALNKNQRFGLCVEETHNPQRMALLLYAAATHVYERPCVRCRKGDGVFDQCAQMVDLEVNGLMVYEERCVGCYHDGVHCIFDDKVRDAPPQELAQADALQILTSPYLAEHAGSLKLSWSALTTDPHFVQLLRDGDQRVRQQAQDLQVSLLSVLNTLSQANIPNTSISDIELLPRTPLHGSRAPVNAAVANADWPPASMSAILDIASRTNRNATTPISLLPSLPTTPASSHVNSPVLAPSTGRPNDR